MGKVKHHTNITMFCLLLLLLSLSTCHSVHLDVYPKDTDAQELSQTDLLNGPPTNSIYRRSISGANKSSKNYTNEWPDDKCEAWSKRGDCKTDPDFMMVNCRKSCVLKSLKSTRMPPMKNQTTTLPGDKRFTVSPQDGRTPRQRPVVTSTETTTMTSRKSITTNPQTKTIPTRKFRKTSLQTTTKPTRTTQKTTPKPIITTVRTTQKPTTTTVRTTPKPTTTTIRTTRKTIPVADCKNKMSDVQCNDWAKRGSCQQNPAWMGVYCQKSCHSCPVTTNYKQQNKGNVHSDCKNKASDVQCIAWAKRGNCEQNPAWMKVNCQKSCHSCPGSCVNIWRDYECNYWAKQGRCQMKIYIVWMTKNCLKACNFCGGKGQQDNKVVTKPTRHNTPRPRTKTPSSDCIDHNRLCPGWSRVGYCRTNDFTIKYCKKSCKTCK